MIKPCISVSHLSHQYGSLEVINDWNIDIQQGERVVLLGPSGAGKTTFLNIVSGLQKPTSGKVHLAADRIGFVFQEARLIPWCTVKENLTFVAKEHPYQDLLKTLELTGFEQYFPNELSGGMQQRVNLARALLVEPDLLILDEAFTSLDIDVKLQILHDLNRHWEERHFTLLAVTHDPKEALLLADCIFILSARPAVVRSILPNLLPERQIDAPAFIQAEAKLIHELTKRT